MFYAYSLGGTDFPAIKDMEIATTQAITLGQVVKIDATTGATRGSIIPAVAGETAAILGIAAENHTGVADNMNLRANGSRIRVYSGINAVFGCSAFRFTATSGSTTTIVNTGLAAFADNDFNGGYLKLVTKGASTTITDPVGTLYKVTSFTGASKTFTVANINGGATAGDVFILFPPISFAKGNFSSNLQVMDFTGATGTAAKIVDIDMNKNLYYWTPTLQVLTNKPS